ncbi:hypothetical protein WMF31_41680 [Sorangium sp. So ce1036]|uniref:hypothetical protein n=1 Tax=Sorangium sp. So ce1036 TaxID=3133328 RepID=UPI003EFECD40
MLIHFVSDYVRNPELQQRASEDPATVLAEYGVTLDVQQVLRRHDRAALLKIAQDELAALVTQLSQHDDKVLFWGEPNIKVTSVSPSTAKVDISTSLTVRGRNFPPIDEARLFFRLEQSNECVIGTITSITTNPSGQSTLLGDVKLPTIGLWKVSVASVGNPDGAGVWDGDFKVTAG